MVAAAAWWVAIVALWPALEPALHRRLAGQQHPQPDLRLQRLRPDHGQRDAAAWSAARSSAAGAGPVAGPAGACGARPASRGSSARRWARRSPGSCPRRSFFLGVLLWGMRRAAPHRRAARRGADLGLLARRHRRSSSASSQGIIHPYYTVVLAPAIGALVGIGVAWTWARREALLARLALAAALAGTAVWAFVLLDRTPTGIRRCATRCSSAGSRPRSFVAAGPARLGREPRRSAAPCSLAALVFALAAPAAYAAQTASTAHSGALPAAGPAGCRPAGRARAAGGGAAAASRPGGAGAAGGVRRAARRLRSPTAAAAGRRPGRRRGRRSAACSTPARRAGARLALLEQNASSYRWVAAVVGVEQRRGRPARDRQARDGDRRLQRHRSRAPTLAAVQGGRRRRARSTTSSRRRRRRWRARSRQLVELERDRDLGRAELHARRPSAA